MRFLYQKILKPFLFCFDPELVHDVFIAVGEFCGRFRPTRALIRTLYVGKTAQPVCVDGLRFPGPVLLAAGFDYNGRLCECLGAVGFAGEEVGSVTARPCTGNTPPRMTRLIRSKSIQVYKGLKNDGVDAVIRRLQSKRIPDDFVLGVSLARTNDRQSGSVEGGIEDYRYSLERLTEAGIGRFYTINISCPNAFGGEDFAKPETLDKLLRALKTVPHSKPMYVKMPINLPWEAFRPLVDIVREHGFQGVVIGNLNKDYSVLLPEDRPAEYRGGLSGLPCRALSNELIAQTRAHIPHGFTIIGCGGILSKEDALEKLRLGADLVQLITGMIFNGPHLIGEINHAHAGVR